MTRSKPKEGQKEKKVDDDEEEEEKKEEKKDMKILKAIGKREVRRHLSVTYEPLIWWVFTSLEQWYTTPRASQSFVPCRREPYIYSPPLRHG